MISLKEFSNVFFLNCAMVLVPALGSTVMTIPQRDFVWGSGLSLNPGEEGSRTQCKLNCDYGYDTDIEGNLICSCNDPCRNIFCFGGTSCVISKSCEKGECRLDASCKDQRPEKSILPLKQQEEASFDISNYLKTNEDTCRQPLSHDVFNCPKRTRRYMFDVTKGRCVRFWGCRKPGNNFDKKRTCKETCITAYKGKSRKSRPRNENCLLPVENVHVVCFGKLRRRWVYDVMKNKCVKIKGCPRPGNNFQKRLECKSQCVRRRKWKKLG